MQTVNLIQQSEEWLEYRKGKVGASEMSYLFGCNPWCKASDQMTYLIGLKLGFNSIFINSAMKAGNEAEADIISRLEDEYGLLTQPLVGYVGSISGSFDGITLDNDIVLEVKNSKHTYGTVKNHGKVPKNYLLQVQTQLYVSGAEYALFSARNPETDELATIKVERDEEMIEEIQSKVKEFYELMDSKVWKESDFSEERIDDEWTEAVDDYKMAKKIADDSKAMLDVAKKTLIELTGGVSTKGGGATVSLSKPRTTVNYKAIVEDNEFEIDDKYKKTGEKSWSIRLKKDK